jgi:hypothetical protein
MSDKYRVEHFSAQNVAVGHRASVRVQASPSAVNEAIEKLSAFVSLLPERAGPADDRDAIRSQAAKLEAALRKKTLNRDRIEAILRKLVLGASGIATLATAVEAVQSAVTRLFT